MWRIKNSLVSQLAGERVSGLNPQTRKPANPQTKRGFTLIELLITTSILGMIALAIFSTFASGLKVYERIRTYSGVQADILLSLEKMEKDLRNTFRFSGMEFVGEGKKISFANPIETINEAGDQNISLGKVSYYFDTETQSLVKEEQAYAQAVSEAKGQESKFKVLAFIENINFSYYYLNSETEKYDWRDSWPKGEGIPKIVKVEVKFKDGSRNVKLVRTVFIPVGA